MTRAVSEVNHVGMSRMCGRSPAWASPGAWGPNRSSTAVTKAGRKAREAKTPTDPRPWRKSRRLTGLSCRPGDRECGREDAGSAAHRTEGQDQDRGQGDGYEAPTEPAQLVEAE